LSQRQVAPRDVLHLAHLALHDDRVDRRGGFAQRRIRRGIGREIGRGQRGAGKGVEDEEG
jgi:hypothetical protein